MHRHSRDLARYLVMATLACAVATAPRAAHAQPASADSATARANARDLGERGFAALDRRDWRAAETFFRRADSTFHAPTLLLGLARAETQLGELVEATNDYQRIIDEGLPPGEVNPFLTKALESAKREIGPVKARCARVVVHVVGPTEPSPSAITLIIDDASVPSDALGGERLLNPGLHRIATRAEGYVPAETSVTLREGESRDVSLILAREASTGAPLPGPNGISTSPHATHDGSPSGTQRNLAIASFAVGGVGLLTGAVSGILALNAKSSLSGSACATGCNQSALDAYEDDRSRYNTTTTVATIGFTVAAVGGIAGAILLLTAPRSRTATRPTILPYAGAGSVGAVGRF